MGRRGFVLDGLGLVAVIVLAFDTNLIDISRRCFYFELSFASLFVASLEITLGKLGFPFKIIKNKIKGQLQQRKEWGLPRQGGFSLI